MADLRLAMPINGADFNTSVAEYKRSNTEVSLKSNNDYQYIRLLANMEGTNGDTSYTEKSINEFPFVFNGSAQISSTQYTYGATSLYMSGAASSYVYVNTNDCAIINGTGDWSIECRVWLNATQTTFALDFRTSTGGVAPTIYIKNNTVHYFTLSSIQITGSTLSNNQWYHIAVAKVSGTTNLYIDGVAQGTPYTDANNYLGNFNRPAIGCNGANLANPINGYIDGIIVQYGSSRYNGNFTPPATMPTFFPTECTVNPLQRDSSSNATVWDMSTFLTLVNPNGESGTVKFKYATGDTGNTIPDYADDDTAYSSTWLTLAQLQAETDPTAGCFRLVMQITGNGSQDGTVTDSSIVATITTTSGGEYSYTF